MNSVLLRPDVANLFKIHILIVKAEILKTCHCWNKHFVFSSKWNYPHSQTTAHAVTQFYIRSLPQGEAARSSIWSWPMSMCNHGDRARGRDNGLLLGFISACSRMSRGMMRRTWIFWTETQHMLPSHRFFSSRGVAGYTNRFMLSKKSHVGLIGLIQ